VAVRKTQVSPAERQSVVPAELESNEDVRLKQLVKTMVRERLAKEWAKGILAFPVAIAGGFLMSWSSKSNGFAYWLGTISGLVIFCIGLAFVVEFLKLLISGDLPKATAVLIKGLGMKEWMRVFLAFLSIGAGMLIFLTANQLDYYAPEWVFYFISLLLIAGGITFFWTRSRFYKG